MAFVNQTVEDVVLLVAFDVEPRQNCPELIVAALLLCLFQVFEGFESPFLNGGYVQCIGFLINQVRVFP